MPGKPKKSRKPKKVILLTGAGASVPAGLKTLKAVVDSIHGVQVPLDNQDSSVDVAKETWKVIRGLRGDKATLEDLLARLHLYIEIADLIKSDHVFSDELKAQLPHVISGQFRAKWENALAFCYRLVLDNYGPEKVQVDSDGFDAIRKAFELICELNGGQFHLFTTNYDCLLSVMASRLANMTFYSHINNETGNFESDWFVVNRETYKAQNPEVYVHRMHGCIAWFKDPRSPYGIHEVFGSGERLVIEDLKKLTQMVIKLISDEKVGTRPAFSLAFQEFCTQLESCDDLLVWGHSFRDLALLRCMINVQSNRRRKFRVHYIDPYLTENDARENIRDTISGEPELAANVLELHQIQWVTSDGWPSLWNGIRTSLGRKSLRTGDAP